MLAFLDWGTPSNLPDCLSSSILGDAITDSVDCSVSSDKGLFSSSNCESDSCGGWDIALSSDSPVKVASLITGTLTGNSLERVSDFMGLVNTILAITSFIVGSVREVVKL